MKSKQAEMSNLEKIEKQRDVYKWQATKTSRDRKN